MKNIKECCRQTPTVWLPTSAAPCFDQMLDMEKIECQICHRVIYGSDDDSIHRWNNGDNDE